MSTATAAPTLENVLYEKKGPIAYVTINRPKVLNALNKATIAELNEVFKDAREDAAVRGVILIGAGDKAFAAGADISEMANDTPAEAEDKTRHGQGAEDDALRSRLDGDRVCDGRLRGSTDIQPGALAVRQADRLLPIGAGAPCQDDCKHHRFAVPDRAAGGTV